jgi:uncharacterized protein (DUF1697 family)
MNKRIAILRGINVGGNRKIVMVDLKKLFNDLGHENVQTYIQSGNVIFEPKSTGSDSEIAAQIERSVTEQYGFNVPVIVLKADQLRDAISFNPFYKKDISDVDRLHITFLKELPEKDSITEIKNYNLHPDNYHIEKRNVFVYCSGKYSDSKLTNKFFENKLKVTATTRNWKTVLKLSELSDYNK